MSRTTKEKLEFTQVTLDLKTIGRFRKMANGRPLASFLRGLSEKVQSEWERREATLDKRLESIDSKLDNQLLTPFVALDKEGKLVPVKVKRGKVVLNPDGTINTAKSQRSEPIIDALIRQQKKGKK